MQKLSQLYEKAGDSIADKTLGYLFSVDPIKFSASNIILKKFTKNELCITSVTPVDFDRNGGKADLLIMYQFEQQDYECVKNYNFYAENPVKVALARRKSWHYETDIDIDKDNHLVVQNLHADEYFLVGERPENFDTLNSYQVNLYGYQQGEITFLGKFSNASEELQSKGIRSFELHRYWDGFIARSPSGYTYIKWQEEGQLYHVEKMEEKRLEAAGMRLLRFDRNKYGLVPEDDQAPLTYDGKSIHFGASRTATILLEKSERLSLDPLCISQSGFFENDHVFSTEEFDMKENNHQIQCYNQNSYSITVREKISKTVGECTNDICPCPDCE